MEYSTLGQESDPFDDNVDENLEWDDNRDWQLMHHDFNEFLHLDPVDKLQQIAMRETATKEQYSTPISCDNLNARQELFFKLIFELLSQEYAGSQTNSYTDGRDGLSRCVLLRGRGGSGKSYVMKYLEENLGEGQVLGKKGEVDQVGFPKTDGTATKTSECENCFH